MSDDTDDTTSDASVLVVGGGPAGLSAALFTAKNGLETTVFDTDETWMHKAHLFNYLGIGSVGGSEFMATARQQVDDFGADRRQGEEVTGVSETDDGFAVETADGGYDADYVILATGANRDLAAELGCEFTDEDVVDVGVEMETSVDDLYATGAMVRVEEWQAAIAVGDGAAAALNILSKEKGERYHDFDVPADAERVFGEQLAE
ncbi:FAD-dependent oxidoreductase [Natronobacterium gregoryi]|uniref:FAD-binding protein n=2 Tax=Natronobacterium gregoryi TaxID=44930 RepID=L0AI75_NATGS|nr:FAD-dependent oxidoreductase [Natronobacterium gregoryi]AFZ72765.1 thioredoxin reductase [Natronobacterium gregoryi SP2]ELY69470.1 FAD-dependent pyridine nucleotide-disulfide oxidoreductase [Natronobacterium gregoryi SP2]PLK21108.1 FAD-binding protein [Natronobacterium gregoryi SP2]SFJ11370.1 Pyridine nucleotide-disulphide oxidoreductase [Natronobacterium gregoryi]